MAKLLNILVELNPHEWQAFGNYIHSPYFCRHQAVIELYDYLGESFPIWEEDLYEKWKTAFEKSESRPRFNKLLSELTGHLYHFWLQEKYRNNPFLSEPDLIMELSARGYYSDARRRIDKMLTKFNLHAIYEPANRLRLETARLDLNIRSQMRSDHLNTEAYFRALDDLNLVHTLKYLLTALSQSRLFDVSFPEERWKKCQQAVQAGDLISPVGQMNYHLIHLIRGEDSRRHEPSLINLLGQHDKVLGEEALNIYGYYQNYLQQEYQRGDENALQRLFQVYKRLIDLGGVFGQGKFTIHLLRNITVVGCRLNRMEWVTGFLENAGGKIDDQDGVSALAYSRAYVAFSKGNFSAALRQLQNVEFVDPFYRTGHQTLLLRVYYELAYFEPLLSLIATFRRYLNRTTSMSEKQKKRNRHFLSGLYQLIQMKEKGPVSKRLQRIQNLLQAEEEITDRQWLYKKLRELEGGRKGSEKIVR